MQRISVDNLQAGMVVGKTLYSTSGHVLLGEGISLNNRYITRLKELGIPAVYVKDGLCDDIEVAEIIDEKTRVEAQSNVKKAFHDIESSGRFVTSPLRSIVNSVVDEILRNDNLLVNLNDIRTFDEEVFGHSVGVTILAIMTGIKFNYNQLQLRDLGIGCLLHDIGKVMLSKDILLKKEQLSPLEFEEIKKHSWDGYEILRKNDDISILSASIALQHHERYDGSGYPQGIKGTKILEFARIASICDVYDAITSDRIYRKAQPPVNAVQTLLELAGNQLDPDIVKIFITNIALYPIGTLVLLNTGEVGVVINNHPDFTDRPLISIILDKSKLKVTERIIDLSKENEIKIIHVLNENETTQLSVTSLGSRIIANVV